MMTWLEGRRFLVLLLALAMLLVAYPILSTSFDARLVLNVLLSILFLAGFLVVFRQRLLLGAAVVLGIPTLVGLWTDYALPEVPRQPLAVALHTCAALFLALTCAAILRSIYKEEGVSADAIYGAFCCYLLIGLVFGHLYGIIEMLKPGSFEGNPELIGELHSYHHRHFVLTYFSFVTLATVGYGDITPGHGAARAFAVIEAVVGQFFIAVLIGELVGKKVAQAITNEASNQRRK